MSNGPDGPPSHTPLNHCQFKNGVIYDEIVSFEGLKTIDKR